MPHFADWCAIDVQQDSGRIERIALAHVDPAHVDLLTELRQRARTRGRR